MSDNTTTNVFEQASRLKLRFLTPQGSLSAEDLWHLPLRSERGANLNDLAKTLNKQIREAGEEDFVEVPTKTAAQNVAQVSLDVVKRVIEVRQEEKAAQEAAAARKEQKQVLLNLLDQKKTAALSDLSLEEIQAKINAL